MFLNIAQVARSLENLKGLHPFFMITFLAFKKVNLPVGKEVNFNIANAENELLDLYFNPAPNSSYYYRASRVGSTSKQWVKANKYASSTLQSLRTRGDLSKALLHSKSTRNWGWVENYVEILKDKLESDGIDLIPAFDLAVWLYRETNWPIETSVQNILETFLREFHITESERNSLFDSGIPLNADSPKPFSERKITWEELQEVIGIPKDTPPGRGGSLALLQLKGIGPAKEIHLEAAERVNLITGDNGLGKTFLLECAWWALSSNWSGIPAYPRTDAKKREPSITYRISGTSGKSETQTTKYDWKRQHWPVHEELHTIPGLIIYARADGAFAVWDPVRNYSPVAKLADLEAFIFTREDVWEGLKKKTGVKTVHLCNGLIYDWNIWQSDPKTYPFNTLKKVLRRLSPLIWVLWNLVSQLESLVGKAFLCQRSNTLTEKFH